MTKYRKWLNSLHIYGAAPPKEVLGNHLTELQQLNAAFKELRGERWQSGLGLTNWPSDLDVGPQNWSFNLEGIQHTGRWDHPEVFWTLSPPTKSGFLRISVRSLPVFAHTRLHHIGIWKDGRIGTPSHQILHWVFNGDLLCGILVDL